MGTIVIPHRRVIYSKTLPEHDNVFDVVYNRNTPSEYTVQFTNKAKFHRSHIGKTEAVKSDMFTPTTFGVTQYNWQSPFGYYYGGLFGGYGLGEPQEGYQPYNLKTAYTPFRTDYVECYYDSNHANRVRTKAVANFADSDVNVGATLAESKETAEYIAQKAGTVFGMIRAIKRGNLSAFRKYFRRTLNGEKIKPRHISRTAAERWLEWKYAVVPLVNDIDGAMSLFANGLQDNRDYNRPWEIRVSSGFQETGEWSREKTYYLTTSTYTRRYKCVLYAYVDDSDAFAKAKLGLNIPSAAWELVPFSFVLDWAVPVGTFLQALHATSGLKFSRGFWHVKSEESFRVHNKTEDNSRNGVRNDAFGSFTWFYRWKLTGFPAPVLYTKNPFSSDNIITALSLFRVLFMK